MAQPMTQRRTSRVFSASNVSTASLLPSHRDPSGAEFGARASESHPASLSDKVCFVFLALYSFPDNLSVFIGTFSGGMGTPLLMNTPEPDDWLHNPDPRRDRKNDEGGTIFTARGLANLGCLAFLALGIIMLFAGYPLLSHLMERKPTTQGGFNLGGVNASGQLPDFSTNFGLIDKDTPADAYTFKSYLNDDEMVLVFSDEFNEDGRSFYPGDDPFWEAVDLHYWGTNDLEWYDPQQASTANGSLRITIDRVDDQSLNHNMAYKSAMVQSWNKFCFTGGLLLANVQLPGSTRASGFWPAVWTLGNLGRAGYGSTLEGLWPYSYDACDVGTLPNQTYPGRREPLAAVQNGDGNPLSKGVLSFLPGQRLSACTCPGESHPGPMRPDGSYVGRAAPEIDVLEALVTDGVGHVSLSAQVAPFNARYRYLLNNETAVFYDPARTQPNGYLGDRNQQCASGLATTNSNCYQDPGSCYALFGFEYRPGFDNAYITWVNEVRSWTLYSQAFGADTETEISARPIPEEPMYIIMNVGISENFGDIDTVNLVFPGVMQVDWVRVYQRKDEVNIGCDPKNFPTTAYIETYKEAYTSPNFTLWSEYGQPWPKNRMMPGGCSAN